MHEGRYTPSRRADCLRWTVGVAGPAYFLVLRLLEGPDGEHVGHSRGPFYDRLRHRPHGPISLP